MVGAATIYKPHITCNFVSIIMSHEQLTFFIICVSKIHLFLLVLAIYFDMPKLLTMIALNATLVAFLIISGMPLLKYSTSSSTTTLSTKCTSFLLLPCHILLNRMPVPSLEMLCLHVSQLIYLTLLHELTKNPLVHQMRIGQVFGLLNCSHNMIKLRS